MSDDLIKRSDAIEAVENVTWYHQNRNKDMVEGANSDEHQAWYKSQDIYEALEALPSAEITADDVLEYCRPRLLTVVAEEALPSADRPRGKWSVESIDEIELSYGGTAYEPVYKCSCCGRVTESYVRFDKPIMPEDADFPNYCGWCGAQMKGADDE